MNERLVAWLRTSGIAEARTVHPMQAGMGATSLWRVERTGGLTPLVIRIFAGGEDAAAHREVAAMRMAAAHGIPTPAVMLAGRIDEYPAVVTTFASGELAKTTLERQPARAGEVGYLLGATLGRLHRIEAPDEVRASGTSWVERGGDAVRPLREHLERVPSSDRLVHLDYHPANVFIDRNQVSAIIDWENTTAAPPHMDLARSCALLRAVTLAGILPPPIAEAFSKGLREGHATIIEPDPHPELSAAWGWSMTANDLSRHLRRPDATIPPGAIHALREEAEQRIRDALAHG